MSIEFAKNVEGEKTWDLRFSLHSALQVDILGTSTEYELGAIKF